MMNSREELIERMQQLLCCSKNPVASDIELLADFIQYKIKEDRNRTIEAIANAVKTYRGMIKEAKTNKDKFSCRDFILALTDIVKELQELWREEYD